MADIISSNNVGNSGTGKVLTECSAFKTDMIDHVIREDFNKNKIKVMRLSGLVQKADVPNQNGRIYGESVMREAVSDIQPSIQSRRVLGEMDHPIGDHSTRINTENACVLLTKLFMEGKNVYGQFEVLEFMPKGKMLKGLIMQGVEVSVSSRGMGDMETVWMEGNEYNRVLPGFKFLTMDIVNEPSVAGTALSITESRKRDLAKTKAEQEKNITNALRDILGQKPKN